MKYCNLCQIAERFCCVRIETAIFFWFFRTYGAESDPRGGTELELYRNEIIELRQKL